MTPPTPAARRAWLSVLAHAPRDELLAMSDDLIRSHAFDTLREPELGLAMVRARIDGAGDRFNLGEATFVRCVVRLRQGDEAPLLGVGYCLGRDMPRSRRIAELDALLQHAGWHDAIDHCVVQPLRARLAQQRAEADRCTASSRVAFTTLQPETAK